MTHSASAPLSLRQVFARNVRLVRVNAGISQENLAMEIGLDRTFLGSLERGERNISIDNIERIAKVLGYPPYELVHPDLPRLRNLDETLRRAPRSHRLYPATPKPRKKSGA